jgi:hypothetical protein
MKKYLSAACSGVVMVGLFTGCSSVLCGTHQAVSFNSRPAGAEVLVYDSNCRVVFQQTTPCVAKLERATPEANAANYIVLLRKPGFSPVQVPLTGKVNQAFYANLIFGGLGMFFDNATGAKWTLTPQNVESDSTAPISGAFQQDDVLVALQPREDGAPDTFANRNWPGENFTPQSTGLNTSKIAAANP